MMIYNCYAGLNQKEKGEQQKEEPTHLLKFLAFNGFNQAGSPLKVFFFFFNYLIFFFFPRFFFGWSINRFVSKRLFLESIF
ncbi:MAG TPA: hypothetical protein PLL90_12505, partial [Bacteroidales bacterium]|nr:hypothetical protein [Bacteroidales bacterium]